MTRIHSLWAIAALCVGASPAVAQGLEFGPGLVLDGNIELQQYHVAHGSDGTAIAPDVTLRWQSYGAFGAEATLDSVYDFKTDDHATNLWAAVTLGYEFGTFKIGAPRPVSETMKPMVGFGSNLGVNTDLRALTTSTTSAMALTDGGFVPGLSFESQQGELSWGVSAHKVDLRDGRADTGFYTLEGVAVRDSGAGKFYGALQVANGDDHTDTAAELGAVWDGNPLTLGLKVGRESIWHDATYGQIRLGYEVMPALRLSAEVMRLDVKNADNLTLFGASAQYDITTNAYVKAGATASTNDLYETYDISLGWTF